MENTIKQVLNLIIGEGNKKNEQVKQFLLSYSNYAKNNNMPLRPLGFSEGTQEHRAFNNALVKSLGRNLKQGERKRLLWIINGTDKLVKSDIRHNIESLAKARAYKGQDIRKSQAVKNYV